MTYALVVMMDVVIIICIAYLLNRRNRINFREFLRIGVYGGLIAVLGSKMLYAFEKVYVLHSEANFFDLVVDSGYSALGGLIFGLVYILISVDNSDFVNKKEITNEYVILICIFHGIWKIACAATGCCYGIKTNLPIGIRYTNSKCAPNGEMIIPIQIIEVICLAIIVFTICYTGYRNKRNCLPIYLCMYGICRYFIEFGRFQTDAQMYFSQTIAAIMLLVGIVICVIDVRKEGRT